MGRRQVGDLAARFGHGKPAIVVLRAAASMKRLPQDVVFVDRMIARARGAGVMHTPRFDAEACQLVEGDLRLDLLNVWHTTHQLTRPDTDVVVDDWIRPKHLGHACYFGRADVVRRCIDDGRPLNGEDYGGNPIAAAIAAWVLTPLHVHCVQMLFDAGAEATIAQFDSFAAESLVDREYSAVRTLLLDHARTSPHPEVRARAAAWSR